jgi:hypothetical protein
MYGFNKNGLPKRMNNSAALNQAMIVGNNTTLTQPNVNRRNSRNSRNSRNNRNNNIDMIDLTNGNLTAYPVNANLSAIGTSMNNNNHYMNNVGKAGNAGMGNLNVSAISSNNNHVLNNSGFNANGGRRTYRKRRVSRTRRQRRIQSRMKHRRSLRKA